MKESKRDGPIKQYTLTKWNEEEEARRIIENNIFGVDLNEESVEITRLSLFLKIATENRKLIDLSNNIKQGNSLINDKSVDPNAFEWEKEFANVVTNQKFDIIIGNPPYIRVQNIDHCIIDWLKQHTTTAFKRVDISILFFELAKKLVKESGIISFITSNQFLVSEYGRKTREFLLKNFRIKTIIDLGDLPIFQDAITYVSIFTLENTNATNFKYIKAKKLDDLRHLIYDNFITIDVTALNDCGWVLGKEALLELFNRIKRNKKISDIGLAWGGIITGLDDVYLLDYKQANSLKIEKQVLLPIIRGRDPSRYAQLNPKTFVLYPYILENGKTVLLPEHKLKREYPNAFNHLVLNKSKLEHRKDTRKTYEDRKDWYRLVRYGQLDMFRKPKIVTPGEVKTHKFCLDEAGAGFSFARIHAVTINDKKYELKYVLALLNSKVAKFFLRKIAPSKKGGYFTYSSVFLNEMPIPYCSISKQRQIVKKVDEISKLKKQYQDKIAMFLNRLISNLNVKSPSRFEDFYKLNLQEFLNEIREQKIKMTLKDQDQWEEYFTMYKNSVVDLENKIEKIDSEIDNCAFDAYQLSDHDKNLIQEFINAS